MYHAYIMWHYKMNKTPCFQILHHSSRCLKCINSWPNTEVDNSGVRRYLYNEDCYFVKVKNISFVNPLISPCWNMTKGVRPVLLHIFSCAWKTVRGAVESNACNNYQSNYQCLILNRLNCSIVFWYFQWKHFFSHLYLD